VNDPNVPNTCWLRPACPLAVSSGSSAPRVARYWARNSSTTASAVRTSRFARRLVSTSWRSTDSWIRSVHLNAEPESARRPRTAAEQAARALAPNHCEEQGDEEDPDGRRDQHPEEHAGADRMAARGPGAARREQRCYTQDEGERRHQDRPQPLAPGLEGRFLDGATLGPQLVRELDDQDGVLGRESHDDDQADLHVHVVRHPA